jgi:hypothetical protein
MKAKIPELTREECSMWIDALKALLKYYKDKKIIMVGCSLCQTSAAISKTRCTKSHYCPWYWFTNIGCNTYSIRNFHDVAWDLRENHNPKWVKLRVAQIPEWIKELEEVKDGYRNKMR